MQPIFLNRYPTRVEGVSDLDHLDDALDVTAFLTAEEFVIEKLKSVHHKTDKQAARLAPRIAAHAKLVGLYASAASTGAPEIAFLPAYYASLNLAKIYCLCGPYENEFVAQTRWHGATYDPHGKERHGLFTDEVRVRKGGALALFYKTLTDTPITGDRVFKLRDIYPHIEGIAMELEIATGRESVPWIVEFHAERNGNQVHIEAKVSSCEDRSPYSGNVRRIPALVGFKKVKGKAATFSAKVTDTSSRSLEEVARDIVKTEFLRAVPQGCHDICSLHNAILPLPCEFASSLAFFHLSSVCRYNPERLIKISTSKAWPMLLTMRRHVLKNSLLQCWSYFIGADFRFLPSLRRS